VVRGSAIVPLDWALATKYILSIVTMFSICSDLAAVFSEKFQTVSGRILETVKAKVTRKWHTPCQTKRKSLTLDDLEGH